MSQAVTRISFTYMPVHRVWGYSKGNETVPLHSGISDEFLKSNPTSYFLNVRNCLSQRNMCNQNSPTRMSSKTKTLITFEGKAFRGTEETITN